MSSAEGESLVARLRRELVDAGFTIHDCAGRSPSGGVCLTPNTARGGDGVTVTWTTSTRLGTDESRYDTYRAVIDVMNGTLAEVVTELGFETRPLGDAGAILVTGLSLERSADSAAYSPELFGP